MSTPIPSDDEQIWQPSLDAMIAAPDYHEVMLENDRVRVLRTRIPPGHRTPIHTHRWAGVLYILSWSQFIRYDDKDNILLDTRTVEALQVPPTVLWSAPLLPHSLENVGENDLHLIAVELKEGAL